MARSIALAIVGIMTTALVWVARPAPLQPSFTHDFASTVVPSLASRSVTLPSPVRLAFSSDGRGGSYAGTRDGVLYSIGPDLQIRWHRRLDTPLLSPIAATPGGAIVVGTQGGVLSCWSFDGDLQWETDLHAPVYGAATRFEAGGSVIAATGSKVWRIDGKGEPLWTFAVPAEITTAPVWGVDRVWVGAADSRLYAIDADAGDQLWSFRSINPVESAPVFDEDGVVYMADQGGSLYAIDSRGELRWREQLNGPTVAPLALADNGDLLVHLGGAGPALSRVSRAGALRWTTRLARNDEPERASSSPAIGLSGGRSAVVTVDQDLVFLTANGEPEAVVHLDGRVEAAPVLMSNGVCAATEGGVRCARP